MSSGWTGVSPAAGARWRARALADAATRWVADPLLAAVFPARCPVCDNPVAHPTSGPLCTGCWASLPRHRGRLCRCGLPLPESLERCGRCRRGIGAITLGASLGPYQGSLRVAIHELKYRGRRRVAARLVAELLRESAVTEALSGSVVLVEVPLHPRRRARRGFNQAELLAEALARAAGRPRARGALVRRRETLPQTGLSARARRRNVANAFAVRQRARIAGRRVVLVDDVLTTGATLTACARALRAAGAREVRVVTVARVS